MSFRQTLGGRPRLDRVVFRVMAGAHHHGDRAGFNGGADVIGYTLLPEQAQAGGSRQRGSDPETLSLRGSSLVCGVEQQARRHVPTTRACGGRITMAVEPAADHPGAARTAIGTPAQGMISAMESPHVHARSRRMPYDTARRPKLPAGRGRVAATATATGFVENAAGQPFRFTLLVNAANRLRQDVATVMQQQLRPDGDRRAELRTAEFQTLLRQQFKARDYDAVISATGSLDNFKVDPTCRSFRLRPGPHSEQSANRAGYCNARKPTG